MHHIASVTEQSAVGLSPPYGASFPALTRHPGSRCRLPGAATYFAAARAASMITFATDCGSDAIGTWLVGSSVVVAPIFFAIARCAPGSIMRSLAATTR